MYILGSYLTHYMKKNRAMQRARADGQISELKARISNLQQELDNSVAVQTDFVRLSQSLQMELEKIRQSEKEVCKTRNQPPLAAFARPSGKSELTK